MIERLKAFKNANRGIENLPKEFEKLANYFILGGYFWVNEKRRVYLCDVEFYYHEENEGGTKDYAMYHRNNRDDKNPTPKYFKIGQLNAHQSGIDITFECKDGEYRAGMLVRGFKIVDELPPLKEKDSIFEYDNRSTYFYEALLNHGSIGDGLSVKWKKEVKNYFDLTTDNISSATRINVPYYDKVSQEKEEIPSVGNKTKKYKPCDRLWRFHIK